MSKKRYVVEPCDNCGSLSPPPPRDRTWEVVDTHQGRRSVASGITSRILAREEARRLNEEWEAELAQAQAQPNCRACEGEGVLHDVDPPRPCNYCRQRGDA